MRPGDRVLFRTTAGELPATVRDAHPQPGGWMFYTVDVDGTPSPRMIALGSQLRPANDPDEPPIVGPA